MAGHIADYPNSKITGAADEILYRSCRYDLRTIQVKVPNGQYKVTLKFCEPYFKAPAKRVFDVQDRRAYRARPGFRRRPGICR